MDNVTLPRRARALQLAVIGSMVVIVLLYVAARFSAAFGRVRVELGGHAGVPELPWASDIGMLLLVVALGRLAQMLGLLAAGNLFTVEVIGRFRGFAFWLMLSAMVGVSHPLLAELLGAADPRRMAFDLRQWLMLLVTLFLFFLARLLERARALEEEAREII